MARNFHGYRVATLDSETEPFSDDMAERGLFGAPFTMGFYTRDDSGAEIYHATWGENCVPDMLEYLDSLEQPHLIFTHNGGRFDFHFLWQFVEEPLFIIDSRLVEFGRGKTRLPGRKSVHQKHVFRDSYSAIPIPLAAYKKTPIDYAKFTAWERDKPENRAEIEKYQRDDCRDLYELCYAFVRQFSYEIPGKDAWSVPLTVGQAAIREFERFHDYETLSMREDVRLRPFYYGGRVQCFAGGIMGGGWRVYDVNSSYPAAMAKFCHPVSARYDVKMQPPTLAQLHNYAPDKSVWFAHITARNRQGIPTRRDGMTDFGAEEGEFYACSHELVPAILSGMVQVLHWHSVHYPARKSLFRAFVEHWYARKVDAKMRGKRAEAAGDLDSQLEAIRNEIFSKFMLNSCYGKFGTDPREFRDWRLMREMLSDDEQREGWQGDQLLSSDPWLQLASRETAVFDRQFYNVATAASITSASRSILLAGLRASVEPIYCDTDSVICRSFGGVVSETEIGAWKFEKSAEFCAIAGKKTYCLFDLSASQPRDKEGNKQNFGKYRGKWIIPAKWASKGGQLPPETIIDIAGGATLKRRNQAPSYSTKSAPHYISRTFRRTVENDVLPFEHGEHSLQ